MRPKKERMHGPRNTRGIASSRPCLPQYGPALGKVAVHPWLRPA